ncbi:MAG TPA: permease, partial [Candidatus Anammoximicrobium sp.]|nr:permease [Candidatus Anammoximicrobium sp.]
MGTLIAGLVHVLLSPGFIHRRLQGPTGVLKAVGIGVPLPLCSCGVIPAGLGLKKDGASDGACIAFLISTPQTGVDSILVSGSFLGWPFALFKVVVAAVTGVAGGWLVDALAGDRNGEHGSPVDAPASRRGGVRELVAHGLDIIRSIWLWLVFGVVVSAAINVFVPPSYLSGLGSLGILPSAVAALAISVPLYVCATASVPIAAALVAGGLPTGAALVFLIAGPATNVATIGAVYRRYGGRVL